MKAVRTPKFKEDFDKLSKEIQNIAKEKFKLFLQNPQHNSLKIKKMRGHKDIWEGHITEGYVFTFTKERDPETNEEKYIFRRIGKHDVYGKP